MADHDRVVAIVQARLGSSRLPRKILAPLAGSPLLVRVLERVGRTQGVAAVCVAAADEDGTDELEAVANQVAGVTVVRGSVTDVLERTLDAAESSGATTVMRVTSDCPMIDPAVSSAVLAAARHAGVTYARTSFRRGYPHGFDTEVISMAALREAHERAEDPYEREHVTPYVWRRPERFPMLLVDHEPDLRHWRLVVDTAEDLRLAQAVYDELGPIRPEFGFADLRELFERRPELLELNADVPPNEDRY